MCEGETLQRQSQEVELVSPRSANAFSVEVTNTSENTWKVPQQPDIVRRKRHPSQVGSPAAVQSPSTISRSPGVATFGASPTSQHVGLKDLLLSPEVPTSFSEETPKRLDNIIRRTSIDKAGDPCSPYLTTQSVPVGVSSSHSARQTHLPQLESNNWQGRPPLILKSLLADPVGNDGTVDSSCGSRIVSNATDELASSRFLTSLSSVSPSSGTTAILSSTQSSLRDSNLSLSTVQRQLSSDTTVASPVARSPLAAMAGLSSMLGNGFVSTANSSTCESPAAVMSRLMVATTSSPSITSTASQSLASAGSVGKKPTNHLLRVSQH